MNDVKPHMTRATQLGLDEGRVPIEYYTDPSYFEKEKDMIFRRAWLMVAREEDLPEPGSFITREVVTLEASVVITRGKDGKLRAFHNTCSHRGVALVQEERGNALTLRCPYHAWTYAIDGKLRAIPCQEAFEGIDKEKNGLAPIHLDTWNGFIFLNFAKEPEVGLSEFLAGLDVLLDGAPFQNYPFYTQVTTEIGTNWKTLVNAFNEGYHVAILHNKTLHPQVITPENPFLHYLDVQNYGPHSVGTVQRNFNWEPSTPVLSWVISQLLPMAVPDKEAIAENGPTFAGHPGINRINVPNFGTEAITIFPNISIQPFANGYLMYQFWPISHDRMRTEVRLYTGHAPRNLREEFAASNTLAAVRDVVSEDMAMCRMQYQGLKSGGKSFQQFGEHELLLRLFIRDYEAYLAGGGMTPTAKAAE